MAQTFGCNPLSTVSRIHNFAPCSPSVHFHQKLVIASKFQIAVAVANNHELVAFRSTVTHESGSGAFNEAKNVQIKVTSLDPQWEIVSIGLNADETLLGAFANNQHGCFVHILDVVTLSVDVPGEAVPLCSIRVGNTASKGIAFEWNPALPDMFAASDNERTLSVAKVDVQNPSKYSILGEKKLEANINGISWSPKGKQLVTGDANGKIYQLKPEIELVRATNAPPNGGSLAVTSLSWLSTTEWLVAYSNQEGSSGGTFMLNIKKDKPPSWTPVDFSGQFSLGETRRLLVDWNVVVVVLPGTGQLLGVCKPANANVWSTIPLASLAQPSPASFVFGVGIDLSRQTPIALADGSVRRLPVLVALNSDGSLRSFQLSPPSKDYPDCNVAVVAVDASKIQRGLRSAVLGSSQKDLSHTPLSITTSQQSATPIAGLFAKIGEQQKAPSSAFATTSPSSGLFAGTNATTQSSSNFGAPTMNTNVSQPSGTSAASAFVASQTTPKSSLMQPSTNLSSVFGKPTTSLTVTQQLSPKPVTTSAPPMSATISVQEKPGPDAVEAARAALASVRASAKSSVEKFRKVWYDSHRDLHSFSINVQKSGIAMDEAVASLSHAENAETADEIHRMVCELDEELCDLLRMVVEKRELIEEKTANYKECRDVELSCRRPLDPLERTQSDSIMQKFEDFTVRLHETKKLIAETKKTSMASKPRRTSEFDPKFESRLHESIKNMARYFAIVRGRVDDVERKTLHLTTKKQLNSAATKAGTSISNLTTGDATACEEPPSTVFITNAPKVLHFERVASKSQQRAKMLEIMSAKKDIKTTTKKVELLRIDFGASDDTLSSSFQNAPNLETSLYQKISSPLMVKPVLTMRNASTQADTPPAAAPTLVHTPSVTSALSSLAASKHPIALTVGELPKTTIDNKLSTSGMVPLATSTPGFKLGESSLKPSGSLFSAANPITPAPFSSQESISNPTEVNTLVGKSIFGASATKSAFPPTESKLLLASTTKTTAETTNESKPLFGNLGATGSLFSEKKDAYKQSTLVGSSDAVTAASEKNEEEKSSLFGSIGTTTSVLSEKKDDKQKSFGSQATTGSPGAESKETKPTSLFGGGAKQTAPTSIFGGGASKPLSFVSSQPAKLSEPDNNKKDNKDEISTAKPSEVEQPEAKSGPDSSLTSTATTTATPIPSTTTSSSISAKSTSLLSTPATAASATTTTSSTLFGTATTTTTSSSLFGTASISSTSPATATTSSASSSIFGAPKTSNAQSSAFASVFGAKDAGSGQGAAPAANAVTFSFKPKSEAEAAQPTASFTFAAPKPSSGGGLGFAAAAAAAAGSTENDEGMDDDGSAGGTSQASGGIFGGGFMSGIGSTSSVNASKNVFGTGTSSLFKNSVSQPGQSSLFKTGQPSIFGSVTQSFASAAQQAAQSNTSPSSSISKSVFGAAPKFGGPPVFGAKPVFGSPTAQQPTAFGATSATGGGFSSFSGNKSLFGGASAGGSSLFGGGTSNQNQPKSSLFGGAQPSSSFSTWR